MDGLRILFIITHISMGLLNVVISRPLINRKIAPNGMYGFRTPKTLKDSRVWYDANAYSGRCLYWAGISTVITGVALYLSSFLGHYDSSPLNQILYLCAGVLIIVIPTIVSVVLSFRYLGRIAS